MDGCLVGLCEKLGLSLKHFPFIVPIPAKGQNSRTLIISSARASSAGLKHIRPHHQPQLIARVELPQALERI